MATKPRKHRPRLALLVPRVVYGGKRFTATVVVTTRAPLDVDWIDAKINGSERINSDGVHSTRQQSIYRGYARLRGKCRLDHGVTELPLDITLPAHIPPSYAEGSVRVTYTVKLQVSIPWWPDARATFALAVGLPQTDDAGKPVLVANNSEGPQGKEPYVEVSLSSDVLAPRTTTTGSVALFNVAANRYYAIDVNIIGTQTLHFSSTLSNTASQARIHLPVTNPSEGQSFPLRFQLPATTSPSHAGRLYGLSYRLEVTARRRWASDLTIAIPITVAPAHGRGRQQQPGRAPAATGSDRVRAVWQRVADQLSMELDDDMLRGRYDDVEVTIARVVNDDGLTRMVATLRFRPLNLGLSIEQTSFLKSGRAGVQIGDQRWDRRHRVSGRNSYQLEAFMKALRSSLSGLGRVSGDDTSWRIVMENTGTVAKTVTTIARNTINLAQSIAVARRQVPPPRVFQPHMSSWKQLASELSGSLDHIGVAVEGTVAGAGIAVRHGFTATGEVSRTLVTLNPTVELDRDHRFYAQRPPAVCGDCAREYVGETTCPACDVPLPPRPQLHVANLAALTGEDLRLAQRVVEDAERLSVAASEIELTLLPQYDASVLLPRINALGRLARVLAPGGAGPYR